jgi:nucleoside-diphosphate-sugar epimerase
MGATESTRDFVHVDDVVRAICAVIARESAKYDVFNIGTGRATSIGDVLRILLKAAGDRRPVVQDKDLLRVYDHLSLTSDISKIAQVLNWRPAVSLEEGLFRLVGDMPLATLRSQDSLLQP